jgi:hypothetical protein
LNSSAQVGTALGIAILFTIATARTGALSGVEPTAQALVEGYRLAFFVGAALAVAAALGALLLVREKSVAGK